MITRIVDRVDGFVDRLYGHRLPILVLVHAALIVAANQAAFWLRFDGLVPAAQKPYNTSLLPMLVLVRFAVFLPLHLHQGVWRYAGVWDLKNIIVGVTLSSVLFWGITHGLLGISAYPRSVFIIDAILLICLMGGVRLLRRLGVPSLHSGETRRVLVYGAGDAGEMVARDMRKRATAGYDPIGFIDDDRAKVGLRIHGVPVLGTRADLARIVRKRRPQEILIAIPTADAVTMRGIVRALEPFKIKITTVPGLREILEGRVSISQIRSLAPEDLLARAPIGLDPAPVRHLIGGRRVMVTGAGGSIGAELCRQLAGFGPMSLVLLDRHENSLFAAANDLTDRGFGEVAVQVVGDVTDAARINAVLAEHQPEIIFHAAAHKHVPLMEHNPCEAIKNNVTGTRILVEAAERHGADRFVLISTDKAVNPTNVMGASKRVAELLLQTRAVGSGTSFFAVRFGNVLASSGSVVPRFLEQIKAGGPVTVTHPEMRRYFMLIPEAVELVLHAAARGENGQIYLLEMGEPVRVLDMARNLIRLLGFIPEVEIPITFTGLRPGEKLQEELVGRNEMAEPSSLRKVVRVRQRVPPEALTFSREVTRLEQLAVEGQSMEILAQLQTIVPEFAPAASASCGLEPAVDEPRVAVERVPLEVLEPAPVSLFAQICPACGSADVHRSKARTLAERIRRSMTDVRFLNLHYKRLFRCHSCDWRGWLVPRERTALDEKDGELLVREAPNLASLDATLTVRASPRRSAFSPGDLRNLH